MAKITWIEYGHKDFNQGWGELKRDEFYQDASVVINHLYELVGDNLWNCINPTSPTVTTILTHFQREFELRELEVIIEEGI